MIPLSVVDAFTDVAFGGNPAAVCLLDRWPPDAWLQLVGREMNLSETAFLVARGAAVKPGFAGDRPRSPTEAAVKPGSAGDRPRGPAEEYELRWFTPKVEVALCGHATLASAHFLWSSGAATADRLTFLTRKSGPLAASRLPSGEIELDFPARPATPCAAPPGLLEALGAKAVAVGHNSDDYLVVLESDAEVRALAPDFARLARTQCRGVIVTARSADSRYDFVSRFFAPSAGIAEDPVTGSAHCCLSEWWGAQLGKDEMTGFQASERGGVARVRRANGRVKLIGRAVTITTGHLTVANGAA
jgi:predicted PhzF superfamily epimerase YddE/YHI9